MTKHDFKFDDTNIEFNCSPNDLDIFTEGARYQHSIDLAKHEAAVAEMQKQIDKLSIKKSYKEFDYKRYSLAEAEYSLSICDYSAIDHAWLINYAKKAETNYLLAVKGRQEFRNAYRKCRDEISTLKQLLVNITKENSIPDFESAVQTAKDYVKEKMNG